VGDDDQSIYGWRGAEVDNILRFERDFPGAKVIRLERNYRSTSHILAAASGLIAANKSRLGKTLWTQEQGGEKVVVRGVWDGEAESRLIADEIERAKKGGTERDPRRYRDMAILVRASFQMRAFEERFVLLQIPYTVVGGPRFFERAEIRDAHAYLRLIYSETDDLAFERIVNVPRRGVGEQAMHTMHGRARERQIPLTAAAASLVEDGGFRGRVKDGMRELLAGFARWREQLEHEGHVLAMATMLDESGYTGMWQQDKSIEAPGRLENLKEFIRALADFETLAGFLDHVSLVMENDENPDGDKVNLMTLHGAKGLEFDTVFLPGWEEGLFPSQRTMDEHGAKGLEEERRLAYVGLTRARQRAIVSHVARRRVYANWQDSIPSRFIEELPETETSRIASAALRRAQMIERPVFVSQFPLVARRVRTVEAWEQPSRPGRTEAIPVGARVFHQKFGYGTVTAAEDDKLDIAFDKAGAKRVFDRFVEPVSLSP
jgi:DNA helicase-2/ATP-dependent DNA helicase PcrA